MIVIKLVVVALSMVALLIPSMVSALPSECWYAAETEKWGDWLWCGIVLVIRGFMQEGPTDGGMPPVQ